MRIVNRSIGPRKVFLVVAVFKERVSLAQIASIYLEALLPHQLRGVGRFVRFHVLAHLHGVHVHALVGQRALLLADLVVGLEVGTAR